MDRVITQYRESDNLLGVIRYDVGAIADAHLAACKIPSAFDLDTAAGEQLTFIGERLGWPRCHCVCVTPPVFGFSCGTANPNHIVLGFCKDVVWADCQAGGTGDLCLADDEVYRGYVRARRFQVLQHYSIDDLQAAARFIWGPSAFAVSMGRGKACAAPGRALTSREEQELPLAFRVLPFAPGIARFVHRGVANSFGFGSGWGGFCDGSEWFCPTFIDPLACA